jgi:hypothetical protein
MAVERAMAEERRCRPSLPAVEYSAVLPCGFSATLSHVVSIHRSGVMLSGV